MDAENPDEEAPESAEIMAVAKPLADAAIAAQLRGDHRAACAAVHDLFSRGIIHAFAGMLRLGAVASIRARPAGSDEPYVPVFREADGTPYDPDAPENAASAFVGRFVAASINGDRDLQRDLFTALVTRARIENEPPRAAGQRVHDATHLLVAAACIGLRREAAVRDAKQHAKHQHPQASRNGRPHRRDQRRR